MSRFLQQFVVGTSVSVKGVEKIEGTVEREFQFQMMWLKRVGQPRYVGPVMIMLNNVG